MTREEKDTLFSLCFGDGCAREKTNGTSNTLYGEFVVTHSDAQLEYLMWKKKLIHSILGGKEPKTWRYQRRKIGVVLFNGYIGKKDPIEYGFRKGHPYFKVVRRMMYPKGVKTFTRPVLNRLTLLGLMIWYLDDGCLSPMIRDGKLRTYHVMISICKPIEELLEIQKYFKEVWNLEWHINKANVEGRENIYKIRMGKKEGSKFLKMIKPLVEKHVPSLMYKIDVSLNPRVQKLSKESKI